jgi:hypothetical protein
MPPTEPFNLENSPETGTEVIEVDAPSPKPKTQVLKHDLEVLFMAITIGGILIALYSTSLLTVIQREAVFVKPQNQMLISADSSEDRKQSLADLLASEAKTKELVAQKPNSVPFGASYLLIGDSMMQDGIGSELEARLRENKAGAIFRKAIQSTGLLHPERLNWYAEVDRLFSVRKYDVVIIMLGLNDADHMMDANGVYQTFGTAKWKVAYARKVEQMLKQLLEKQQVKKVVWVGLPVGPDRFWDTNVRVLNEVYRTVTDRYVNAIFVDTYDRFKVNGRWASVVKDNRGTARVARQSDGLHMTIHGGKITADLIIDDMKKNNIPLGQKPPTPRPTPSPEPTPTPPPI